MPFEQVDGGWLPKLPRGPLGTMFGAGVWNVGGTGDGRFTPVVRDDIAMARRIELLVAAGATLLESHSTDIPTDQAREMVRVAAGNGARFYAVTANLFKSRADYATGNFGSPLAATREMAFRDTTEYLRTGIEVFEADVGIYWNGSNGITARLSANYMDAYKWTIEGWCRVTEWMLDNYGPERALSMVVEAKTNEPPSWGMPSSAGEAAAMIAAMDERYRPFWGVNPEKCHESRLGPQNYAMVLAMLMALGRLRHVHLNDGSGMKFDEDHAWGDDNMTECVEEVVTLKEVGYEGPISFDVTPLITDDTRAAYSVQRSVANFRRALVCADRIDLAVLDGLRDCRDWSGINDLLASAVTGID